MKFLRLTSPQKQRGLALIMAVLIAALATSAIAFAAWRQQVRLRDAEIRADSAQAQQVVRSSITLARTLLIDDINNNSTYDYLGDDWAKPISDVGVEQGKVSGHLVDMQGRFNLNSLIDPTGPQGEKLESYKRLLNSLSLDPSLGEKLLDWLDADDIVSTNGAEDMVYLAKNPAYRAANRPLSDLSELLLVDGYTQATIDALSSFVSVYPLSPFALININTTSPEVLAAIVSIPAGSSIPSGARLSVSEAKTLLNDVATTPYKTQADFAAKLTQTLALPPGNQPIQSLVNSNFDVTSQYFQADLRVTYGKVTWHENVFLWRSLDRNPALRSKTLWRRRVSD